jgi:hypothetical protein
MNTTKEIVKYKYLSIQLDVKHLPIFIRLKPNRHLELHLPDCTPDKLLKLEVLMGKWFDGLQKITT